jgi:uncharacterized membrane-anchored protein YjiN (DUF445 family)
MRAWLSSLWRGISKSALRDLEQPSSATRLALHQAVASLGRALVRDEAMISHIDAAAERIALFLVARRRDIASVVDEVVRGWDARQLTDRLELVVGSDLQYIRMNGTVVGAGVGCLLFILSRLLGADS